MKYLIAVILGIAALYYLGNMRVTPDSIMAPIVQGAAHVSQQINQSIDKAVDKVVDGVVNTTGDVIQKKSIGSISWLIYGTDKTGLRGKSRDEMESAGIPEEEIDDARIKSYEWITEPEGEKEEKWQDCFKMIQSAYVGTPKYRTKEELEQEMKAVGASRDLPGTWFDINVTPEPEIHNDPEIHDNPEIQARLDMVRNTIQKYQKYFVKENQNNDH